MAYTYPQTKTENKTKILSDFKKSVKKLETVLMSEEFVNYYKRMVTKSENNFYKIYKISTGNINQIYDPFKEIYQNLILLKLHIQDARENSLAKKIEEDYLLFRRFIEKYYKEKSGKLIPKRFVKEYPLPSFFGIMNMLRDVVTDSQSLVKIYETPIQ